jgi:hypothetical protein
LTGRQSNTSAGTLATERPAKQTRVFDIPIKNSLLEPKHYRAIGESIWFFLWCVDRITREVVDEAKGGRVGLVLGSMPHHDADIARSLGCSTKTLRRWRKRLVDHGYLGCLRTPNGYVLWVNKSKKWHSSGQSGAIVQSSVEVTGQKRPLTSGVIAPTCPVELPNVSSRVDTNGKCNKTLQLTSPETVAEEGASRAASSLSTLEAQVLSSYEKFRGRKPLWRKSERSNLERLAQAHSAPIIIAAVEVFLKYSAEFLERNGHPFGLFAKQFAAYDDRAAERRREGSEGASVAERDEIAEEVERESVEVEIISGPRRGRRHKCHPDVAKLWFANGYARSCGDGKTSSPEMVDVVFWGTQYRIEKTRAERYLGEGFVQELATT